MSAEVVSHFRSCHLCEAICGVEIKTEGDKIISIRGDKDDPFSRGHICPKATALQDLHEDPDRLKFPMKRVGEDWQQISWDEAYSLIAEKFTAMQEAYGNDSIAFFAGNPCVHNYGTMTHGGVLRKAVGTKMHFSATSLDQLPHQLVGMAMFGHQFMLPVPDIDHTNYMLILGGNPLASNGSMMTVPDVKKRLKSIQDRGGKFVVIDPRRTETAAIADQHHFIRPSSDAYLLLAMIHTLFDERLVKLGHMEHLTDGVDDVKAAVGGITPELAEKQTGIAADDIRDMARNLATIDGAVVYGRMGVSTQKFGTLCQWAIQVLNVLAGNFDTEGGAIVCTAAFGDITNADKGAGYFATWHSRVSGLPVFSGELPATVFAEEILTPGEGQVKGLITIAGNPALSAPNGDQVEKALESLDFIVSIDLYMNETTRHADVILPPTGALEHDNYDISFNRLAVRDVTRYSEPVFDKPEGTRHDWEIMNELSAAIAERRGTGFRPLPAPHQLLDMGLKAGPYAGENDITWPLDLAELKKHPHGIDLGPLKPGIKRRLKDHHPKVILNVGYILGDIDRLDTLDISLGEREFILIGRRHVRSNNSWMHNSPRLVKGPPRWHLLMHPDDLKRLGLDDKGPVKLTSRVGTVQTTVSASDELMPGVISLPHGWGHNKKGTRIGVAAQQDGVNCNLLTDNTLYDHISGNSALNSVKVTVD